MTAVKLSLFIKIFIIRNIFHSHLIISNNYASNIARIGFAANSVMAGISGLAGAGMSAAASEVAQGNMSHGVVRANMINMNKYDAAMANSQGRTDTWQNNSNLSSDSKISHDTTNSNVSSYKEYDEINMRNKYAYGSEYKNNTEIDTQSKELSGKVKRHEETEFNIRGTEKRIFDNNLEENRNESLSTNTKTMKKGEEEIFLGQDRTYNKGAIRNDDAQNAIHAKYAGVRALEKLRDENLGNRELYDKYDNLAKEEKARLDKIEKEQYIKAHLAESKEIVGKQEQAAHQDAKAREEAISNAEKFLSSLSNSEGWSADNAIQKAKEFGLSGSVGVGKDVGVVSANGKVSLGIKWSNTETDTYSLSEMSKEDIQKLSDKLKSHRESITSTDSVSVNYDSMRLDLAREYDKFVLDNTADSSGMLKAAPITTEAGRDYINNYQSMRDFNDKQNDKYYGSPEHEKPGKMSLTNNGQRNNVKP